uniref:Uncharacterized protein n=1 Tax=Physcomitrium patens TaxID=3218 RepID=A0A2K1KXD4_PHYPA|nr:hypothetical protein PHYPA_005405 [Physcomitrium patens]
MPGRVLIPETASRESGKMENYKLAFPGAPQQQSTKSGFRGSFMGRRFNNDFRKVQPSKTSMESPEVDICNTGTISEDDSSVFTASTRTSNTISDDDSSLMDFGRASADFAPARHSTACCTDLQFRRDLRKRFQVEPALDEASGLSDSFAVGHSFRRELEKEDRVESLALWEETEAPSSQDRTMQKYLSPHSWHGDTASSASSRNRMLESIFRKPRKSFLSSLFSGLTFSTSRRPPKS